MLVREGGAAVEVLAQVLAAYGVPVAPRRARCRSRARGSAPACSRSPAPRCPAARAADVLTLAAHARQARRPRRRRRARRRGRAAREAATAARRAPRCWARRAAASSTRSPRPRPTGPAALLDALLAEAEAIWTAPHRRARRRARRPRRPPTRARPPRCAPPPRELRALAEADPALLAGGAEEVLEALGRRAGPRGRGAAAACSSPTRSAIRARRFRAVFVCGLQDGEFPRRPSPEPFLDDDARALAGARQRARAAAATRTCWRASATCFYAASRGPRRCCSSPSAPPTRRATRLQPSPFVDDVRALFTDELWERARPPAARRGHLAARRRRRRRTSCAARARPPRSAPEPPPLGAPAHARRCWRRSPRASPRPRAGWRRSPPAACAGWSSACCSPSAPSPTRSRCAAARSPTRCSSARCAACASARARRGWRRTRSTRRSAELERGARRAAREPRPAARAPAAGGCARSRSTCGATCATRPRAAPGSSREWLEWSFGGEGDEHGPLRARRRGLGVTGRVDRIDVDAGGQRAGARLQGPHGQRRRALGAGRPAAGRALRARGARAARARAGRRALPAARRGATCRPRGLVRDGVAGPLRQRRRRRRRGVRRALLEEAREAARGAARATCAPAGSAPCPDALLAATAAPTRAICRAARGRPRVDGARRRAARRAFTRRAAGRDRRPHAARRCSPPTPARARPR